MYTDTRPLRFPQDILRFLYWVFFKPITLEKYLHQIDPILKPAQVGGTGLWTIYHRKKEHPEFLTVIQLALFNILVTPFLAFPLVFVFQLFGFEANWFYVALYVTFGLIVGMLVGVVLGTAAGVALSVTVGVPFGMAGGLALGVSVGKSIGVVFGITGGVTLGIAFYVVLGMVLGILGGVAFGIVGGVGFGTAGGLAFGMFGGRAFGLSFGVTFGIVFSLSFILSYLRLPLYFFQIILSFLHNRLYMGLGLNGSPVIWDEMIWLPLPELDGLLVQIGKQDRKQGLEAIAFVAASFRQGWAAKRALLELTADDVRNSNSLETMAEISQNLSWLPDDARMDMQDLLLTLEQASQHARAALESETLYNRQEQLRMGLQVIGRMRSGLALAQKSEVAQKLIPALEGWKNIFTNELAASTGKEQVPNVYVSGSPLIKDSKVFKGRKDLFYALTNELVTPAVQRPALLLFGARRMGKTSTLKQLPIQLGPQIVPVSIDLQKAGTVENAANLLYLIAREIVKSAHEERHQLRLPEISRESLEKDPYLAFQEWLDVVESKLGDYYWILLALDEFESLGEMLANGRIDERLFQMLRGVIQGHPRITVLMSGAHTLEELPPLWSNYLINTKMLKVNPLAEADARELITSPIPDFPLTYDDDAVELILCETGCHPNWMQCICRDVVERMNEANCFHATRADVESALDKVPQTLAGDFKDLWEGRDSSDLMRGILKTIATAKDVLPESKLKKFAKPEAEFQKTMDFLTRRDILIHEKDAYRFRAALLKRWVAKQN